MVPETTKETKPSYLLDTCVISEWTKPRPDVGVMGWLSASDETTVCLSVISLAELARGVELLPAGRRREVLDVWLVYDLPTRFEGRILQVTPAIAAAWGRLMALARRGGFEMAVMDGFFAATAVVHSLTFVTRNTRDFERLDIPLLNPWSGYAAS